MSPHTRFLHELHYWIEVAVAPLLLWALYLIVRYAWRRGWLGDDWPDPQVDVDADESADDVDLTAVQHPDVEEGEPAPWRR